MTAKPPSPEEAAQHRSWRRWAIGSVVVLLVVLSPFAALWIYEAQLGAAANHLAAELDRVEPGWRSLLSDLESMPSESDSIARIRKAAALMPKDWNHAFEDDPDSVVDGYPLPCRLPARDEAALAALVARYRAPLDAVRALENSPGDRFQPKRSTDGKSWDWSDVYEFRKPATLLDYSIRDMLQHGDIAGALHACRSLVNLGKPLGAGVPEVGYTRAFCDDTAVKSIERTLAHGQAKEVDLASLQRAVAEEADFDFYFTFLAGDCELWLRELDVMIDDLTKFETLQKKFGRLVPNCPPKAKELGWWDKLNERYPRIGLLKTKIASIERMAATWRLKPLRGFARYEAIERLHDGFEPPVKDGFLSLVWISTIQKHEAKRECRIHAHLRCAEVGLAAERFRLENNRWPKTANELFDKGLLDCVPEDPFDGNPLRMRPFAEGIVVYSVGKDRDYAGTDWDDFEDLGGRFREGIEFRLWNPERRHQAPLPAPSK